MIKNALQSLIYQTADKLGYSVYDFSIYLKGENSKLAVKIDKLEGVSHNDCGEYSRELIKEIELSELLPDFSLEVSSPGVKREIRGFEEFKRFLGAPVKVIFTEQGSGKAVKGKLVSVENDIITVEENRKMITIQMKDITQANLDY